MYYRQTVCYIDIHHEDCLCYSEIHFDVHRLVIIELQWLLEEPLVQ